MVKRLGAQHLCLLAATWLLGGLLGATLVRIAPGFDTDEREMDGRYSRETVERMRAEKAGDKDVLGFYGRYLAGLARGDFGVSRTFGTPVRDLLAERFPVTARAAGFGLVAGWALALAFAIPGLTRRNGLFEVGSNLAASSFLSLPTALVALLFVNLDWPPWVGLAVVVYPRVFRYTRNILAARSEAPAVFSARAAGVRESRILLKYILWPAAPELLAVVGVSASLAFSASIPMEALCDVAGVGSLAWQAALSRDFPLLVNVTMLVALIVLGANALSEILTGVVRREAA